MNMGAGMTFTSKWEGSAGVRVEGRSDEVMLINCSKRPTLPIDVPVGFPVKTQTVGIEIDGLFYGIQVRYLAHAANNPETNIYSGEPIREIFGLAVNLRAQK